MCIGAITNLPLMVRPFLVTHFVHIINEMGRHPVNSFSESLEVHHDLLLRYLEPLLFHWHSFARFETGISVKHVSDRIRVHCLVALFADTPGDIGSCTWATVGIAFGDVFKKFFILLGL
jgi:hypothetical protein